MAKLSLYVLPDSVDLAVRHLRLVEDQLRQFRARRAVLRTIVRQRTTTEQVSLMHKLVSMSDDDVNNMITNGKGRMPKYGGKLSPEEIDTLVRQIKEARGK